MISVSNLLSLALLNICLLFAVAWFTDRKKNKLALATRNPARASIIYALTLGVYCSSWTFYGAVGSATAAPWSHAPIYLGPIFLFVFGWPLIKRLLAVGARHRVTSIADYIGARYGKRQSLAIIVTLVATAAVLPYIALQFKALAQAWLIIEGSNQSIQAIGGDTALFTSIVLAIFTILFGTRRLDTRERHQGLMNAIALESVIKLVAFVAVAVLAIDYLADISATSTIPAASYGAASFSLTPDFIAQILISALAIICLPRQFHVMVVEGQEGIDTRYARWIFPLYLLLFMLLVIPISLAGSNIFYGDESINPDTYVQLLPRELNSSWVTLAAFIGGFSAATGMVIVATVSLAIMITNEIITPVVMRLNVNSPSAILKLGDNLRRIRQITIAGILISAWLVTRQLMDIPWLTQIGFISFLAAAQLAPAIVAGLYWKNAHGLGVLFGLILGLGLWFYCGVLPAVMSPDNPLIAYGPLGISWLSPVNLFNISSTHRLSYASCWSLGVNLLAMIVMSRLLKPSAGDIRQARLFIDHKADHSIATKTDFDLTLIRISQLQGLLPPFVEASERQKMWVQFEEKYQQRLLPEDRAPRFVVEQVESILASIIGATSAHKIMTQLEDTRQLEFSDFVGMVSDARKLQSFNKELLEITVENLIQGLSVVDSELRLVAWNSRYQDMFDYPERFLYIGCPVERIYQFNAERGILTTKDTSVKEEIKRRLEKMRKGSAYQAERLMPDGKVIQIDGRPIPNGGFVTTYIDVTDYREMVKQLEDTRQELEQKVVSGTQTLSETNAELRQENRLRAQVEANLRDAHLSKSRFMSATSHDLLQPINAARLFTTALKPRLKNENDDKSLQLAEQIDTALNRAEKMISELREISKLDSGRETSQTDHFPISDLFAELRQEFSPIAKNSSIEFHVVNSSQWLHSDQSMIYRILQNLLSNALHYTSSGRVTLGVRRRKDGAEIQVIDTGPGIAEQDRVKIFQEFERGARTGKNEEDGLGLGLAIVQRYTTLLNLPLHLLSSVGQGTLFSILLPYGEKQQDRVVSEHQTGDLDGLHILCLDNEPLILKGMEQVLLSMNAMVSCAKNRTELTEKFNFEEPPDILLVDYHLDNDDTGISVAQDLLYNSSRQIPCIVISANNSDECREEARKAGFRFLAKPVNTLRLRAFILALCNA
jgi:Na+/proline symporter/signal transduction histidine kinase/CheY-like chemotaxis protein